MKHPRIRLFPALLLSIALAASGSARAADALSVTIDLAGLPTSITLCGDPTAIQFFSIEEKWGVGIDNNVSTGAPPFGFDVLLLAHTLPQQSPCTATTSNTADSLVVDALAWNAGSNSLAPF